MTVPVTIHSGMADLIALNASRKTNSRMPKRPYSPRAE
jgi:hypothetical protein